MVAETLQSVQTMRMSVNHNAKPFTWQGKQFPSMTAFCYHYGLHVSTVRKRLQRGLDVKWLTSKPYACLRKA